MTLPRDLRGSLGVAACGVLFMLVAPALFELFTIINLTTAIALGVLALSLALVWGYGGILSFGQTVFFGLGAYAYTVAAINFGGSSWAILVAILVAAAFAAALGYFMFYARVSDVYLAVITLTVSLIFYSLIRRTSGPDYRIGKSLLGGFNGVTSPPLNLPWDSSSFLYPEHLFYVAMSALILAYLLASWLVRTHFGRVCVSIRENELRAELLGYDVRLYKLGIFAIGGGNCGSCGSLVLQRRRPGDSGRVQSLQRGAHHHLGDRGRERDARGARPRSLCAVLPHFRTRHPIHHQQQPGPRRDPRGVRAGRAEGRRTYARRVGERRARPPRRTRPCPAPARAPLRTRAAGQSGVRAEMRKGEVVLETRGLSMHFGGLRAVDRVDFMLRENELRCLIGPNGAGKSTFFKCLTGQLRPSGGDVVVRDAHMKNRDAHEVADLGVGIKTQVPNVFDGLDVEENVWLSARRRRTAQGARRLTSETLERLRLGEFRRHAVGRLSHGQRQWVELGMVIAAEPWLVLLDEPAAGMTQEETVRTAELIKEINRSATLIVVEHDMQFIRKISTLVTLFHEGRILMEGTMDAISADPRAREVYLGHRDRGAT